MGLIRIYKTEDAPRRSRTALNVLMAMLCFAVGVFASPYIIERTEAMSAESGLDQTDKGPGIVHWQLMSDEYYVDAGTLKTDPEYNYYDRYLYLKPATNIVVNDTGFVSVEFPISSSWGILNGGDKQNEAGYGEFYQALALGDLNLDGKVNTTDANILLKFATYKMVGCETSLPDYCIKQYKANGNTPGSIWYHFSTLYYSPLYSVSEQNPLVQDLGYFKYNVRNSGFIYVLPEGQPWGKQLSNVDIKFRAVK